MIDLRSSETNDLAENITAGLAFLHIFIILPTFLLTLLSIPTQTPFFHHITISNIIITNLINLISSYFSEYAFNFLRLLLFYPWIKYIGPFFSQWETFIWQQDDGCPLFYIDVRNYTSLTHYFDDHLNTAKSKKDDGPDEHAFFKFARKSKRNILTSVPNTIKRLIENDCLEIRTRRCTYLTHTHFRMMYEHTIATEISYDNLKVSGWFEILRETAVIMQWLGLAMDGGVMDEFWVNGKLVAFQTSVIMGEVLMDGMWAILPEARQFRLYFEANRLLMKRAIADPTVKYLNLQVMEVKKESLCLPKRKMFAREISSKSDEDFKFAASLCGFPDYVVSCENLGLWVKMFGSIRVGEEFWNVKDKSDLY